MTKGNARNQGADAYIANKPKSANPFPPDSADHVLWDAGWEEAQQEVKEDE